MMQLGYGYLMSLKNIKFGESVMATGPLSSSALNFLMDGKIPKMKKASDEDRVKGIIHAFNVYKNRNNELILLGQNFNKLYDLCKSDSVSDEEKERIAMECLRMQQWFHEN
jgi:hypothetical protein